MMAPTAYPLAAETPAEHARHILMFCGALHRIVPESHADLLAAIERRAWRIVTALEPQVIK